jgi:hypothetical protein
MNSNELSKTFNKLYNELNNYITDQLKSYNRTRKNTPKFDSITLRNNFLAECYIHLDKCKDDLLTENTIIAYSKKFIRSNMYWSNSKLWKLDKSHKNETVTNINDDQYGINTDNNYINDNTDLDFKMINDKINEFKNNLSLYNKGLYEIYFTNYINDSVKIATHLNISKSSGYNILKECKNLEKKLKKYLLQYI